MHVLLVEDDPALGRVVRSGLEAQHHVVELAPRGDTGLELALGGGFDVVVLDWMLPGLRGVEVRRRLGAEGGAVPVLMLPARDAVPDRVEGLISGADDYLVKPFDLAELQARVIVLGRRRQAGPVLGILRAGALSLDLDRRAARAGETVLELTAKEFALLEYLARNAGQVLSRDQILQQVWGSEAEPAGNAVDIYIHFLRRKLSRCAGAPRIRTVRGLGYSLEGDNRV